MTFQTVPLTAVVPNPDQPRQRFDEDALDELAASIRTSGLLQPLVVRPNPAGDPQWLLIAGERRWRACHRVPLEEVDVRILEGLDDTEAFIASFAENVNRRDMTLTEEARAFAKLVGLGRTPEEVGRLFGKSKLYVQWRIPLVGLVDEVAFLVDSGGMTPTAGYYAAKLSPAGQQVFSRRYVKGEFRTESDAVAAARAYLLAEQQTELWADQSWEPAGDGEPPARFRRDVTRLTSAERALTQLARQPAPALAGAADLEQLRDATERVVAAAQTALMTIRAAAALRDIREEQSA